MPSKKNLPVTYKPCAKCGGSGQVPCDGKEPFRIQQKEWAESFNGKPVLYKGYESTEWVPGVAVAQLLPGGWHEVRIYLAVTARPKGAYIWADSAFRLDDRGVPHAAVNVGGNGLWSFDIINDKAFWHTNCRWDSREDLVHLDYWPEIMSLEVGKGETLCLERLSKLVTGYQGCHR